MSDKRNTIDLDWALTQAEEEERSSWEKYGTDDAAPTTERHPEPRPCPADVSYMLANASWDGIWGTQCTAVGVGGECTIYEACYFGDDTSSCENGGACPHPEGDVWND